MPQRIPPLSAAAEGSSARVCLSEAALRVVRSSVWAVVLLALAGLATPLAAQDRGTLQVAAQVLLIEPSRGALAMGMGTVRSGRVEDTGGLAAISVTPSVGLPADLRARRRPAVLTIAFIRN
jgi:hypothetical protein